MTGGLVLAMQPCKNPLARGLGDSVAFIGLVQRQEAGDRYKHNGFPDTPDAIESCRDFGLDRKAKYRFAHEGKDPLPRLSAVRIRITVLCCALYGSVLYLSRKTPMRVIMIPYHKRVLVNHLAFSILRRRRRRRIFCILLFIAYRAPTNLVGVPAFGKLSENSKE
jgi:hypothetical protein